MTDIICANCPTGDISNGDESRPRSGFQTTPIVVDGTLYLTTPTNQVIALDPERGDLEALGAG